MYIPNLLCLDSALVLIRAQATPGCSGHIIGTMGQFGTNKGQFIKQVFVLSHLASKFTSFAVSIIYPLFLCRGENYRI